MKAVSKVKQYRVELDQHRKMVRYAIISKTPSDGLKRIRIEI